MVELASEISRSVAELQELVSAQGKPAPSFDEDSPRTLPDGAGRLQDAVLDATLELHEMLLDPMSLIYKFAGVSVTGAHLRCHGLTLQARQPRQPRRDLPTSHCRHGTQRWPNILRGHCAADRPS